MKIMAVDFGDVRTGLSFSDLSGFLAGRSITIKEKSKSALIAAIAAEYTAEGAGAFVVGLPKNMDGTEGPRAQKARAFADELSAALGTQAIMWDERGTSVSAARILSDAGKKRGRQKAQIDAVAASIILQGYLDFLNRK